MFLEISGVSKRYGKDTVLKDVHLSVREGECHGLIGKNGSGKSTLINMIIDIVEKDEGMIRLFGFEMKEKPEGVKRQIGVLPEFNPLIEEFSLYDYLRYIALMYELDEELIQSRIEYLIEYFFESKPGKSKQISGFSKGMKLKTGLCAALIHKPKLLILDEPFDGMDMFSSQNLAEFLNDYCSRENAVLVSSHDMLFMDKIATHVSVIKDQMLEQYTREKLVEGGRKFDEELSRVMGYNPKELKEY